MVEAVESYADTLAEDLDKVEERLLTAEASDQHQAIGRVRKLAVRLHRQLATQRSLIHRFEREMERSGQDSLQFATAKLAQRLDWLDHEMVALRDRSHLLQEECRCEWPTRPIAICRCSPSSPPCSCRRA